MLHEFPSSSAGLDSLQSENSSFTNDDTGEEERSVAAELRGERKFFDFAIMTPFKKESLSKSDRQPSSDCPVLSRQTSKDPWSWRSDLMCTVTLHNGYSECAIRSKHVPSVPRKFRDAILAMDLDLQLKSSAHQVWFSTHLANGPKLAGEPLIKDAPQQTPQLESFVRPRLGVSTG
ncbi:hypothetical protein Moror_13674 [Moniliophthora roreri MCA 2997]|uniref:Uncharacterized protein n=1 Tax=Moniliophthora roreri (strain MCA 2997) TaxID=1381753 RepID=V2WU69_MONRO|nr:hypothetical protein Moror_13674 [Moniliophthora roreri MCA 2997]